MRASEAFAEARRCIQICNACRYCEGYCAVFPAMELRRAFSESDLGYLANLCHDCRGCYYACQYAPPHEFALNLPRSLAEVRHATYVEYAWPRPLAVLFQRNGTLVSLVTALCIALALLLTRMLQSPEAMDGAHIHPGAFYAVIPERVMVGVAGAVLMFALVALCVGLARFWREGGGVAVGFRSLCRALSDVLAMRYLGGAGHGCNDRGEPFSRTRRYMHHALFYGFLLCFASTCSAAAYEHLLGRLAPYPFFSLPVLLGTVGGIGMLIGSVGLLRLKMVSDQAPTAQTLRGGDVALLLLLFLAAATGEMLLAFRGTGSMGTLLALHLGVILSFFVVLPYSKFVHGAYRSAALLRHAAERRRP